LKQYPEGKWTEEARIRVENFSLAQAPSTAPATEAAPGAPGSGGCGRGAALRPAKPKPSAAGTASTLSGRTGGQPLPKPAPKTPARTASRAAVTPSFSSARTRPVPPRPIIIGTLLEKKFPTVLKG
jgi:hypothetical protein